MTFKKFDAGINTREEKSSPKCARCHPREGCMGCGIAGDVANAHYPQGETVDFSLDMICDCKKCAWCLSHRMEKVAPGIKEDSGKLRLDLIDPVFQEYLAKALGYGADKYDDHNWLKGMQWSRVYAALLRHLRSWYMGEDIDEESGNHHLAHAAAMLMFLVGYVERDYSQWDDRKFLTNGEDVVT